MSRFSAVEISQSESFVSKHQSNGRESTQWGYCAWFVFHGKGKGLPHSLLTLSSSRSSLFHPSEQRSYLFIDPSITHPLNTFLTHPLDTSFLDFSSPTTSVPISPTTVNSSLRPFNASYNGACISGIWVIGRSLSWLVVTGDPPLPNHIHIPTCFPIFLPYKHTH